MRETNATLPPNAGAAGSTETQTDGQVRQLAQKIGDDWKNQPYYDDAERYMEQQWRETVWPFIQGANFSSVLDLAAGHGRNSEKLKQHARKIHIVDINQENIDFCRKRFAGDPRFSFTRNDGCSLDFIPTASISLVYCFDAMVHFDSDVVRAYLREFKRILPPGGLGFCHHSNFTENPGENVHASPGWRNFMSQAMFAHYCAKEGLTVVKSRLVNWERQGSDCVTLFRNGQSSVTTILNEQSPPLSPGWPVPANRKAQAPIVSPSIFNSAAATTPLLPVPPIIVAPINRAETKTPSTSSMKQSHCGAVASHADALAAVSQTKINVVQDYSVPRFANVSKSRPIVVVLGMHRSGTSLLANLLTALGVNLGEKLLAADGNNQAGYWEQEEIYLTQDALLQQLGRHWPGPSGTIPFPAEWWRLPEIQPFKQRLTSILRKEIEKTDGVWGFKDPRTSRLLPLWKEIFVELGLDPIYLLAIRNPAEVVESVVKRDEMPAARAELLWLLHNLDAVRDAGDQLRLVVDYDRWFTHPREQAQAVARALDFDWPAADDKLLASLSQRIRPDLRHCRTPQPFLLPMMKETFTALQTAAATEKFSDELEKLDRELRRAILLCRPWADVVEKLTQPKSDEHFSFVGNFLAARPEPLGPEAQAAVWDTLIDGPMQRSLFLHPPARLHFHVPDGRRARLTFAVSIHPHAWRKPNAGGCEFILTVDETVRSSVKLDPVRIESDRRWHECTLDIPENLSGTHIVVFETRPWGSCLDYRWAVWRDPRLTWLDDVPALPSSAFGEAEPVTVVPLETISQSLAREQKTLSVV